MRAGRGRGVVDGECGFVVDNGEEMGCLDGRENQPIVDPRSFCARDNIILRGHSS